MQLCSIFSKLKPLSPSLRPPMTRSAGFIPVIVSSVAIALTPGLVNASTVYTGTLEPGDAIFAYDGSLYDDYAIQGERGEQLTIQLQSDEFDPFVAIVGPQGEWLLQNNNASTTDQNAELSFTFPDNSVYHVFVNTYAVSGRGTYTLSLAVNRESSQSKEVVVPQPLVPMPPPVILDTTGGVEIEDSDTDIGIDGTTEVPGIPLNHLDTMGSSLNPLDETLAPLPIALPQDTEGGVLGDPVENDSD